MTSLLERASAAFPDLGPAESALIQAVATGDEAMFGAPSDDPGVATDWGDERRIRARVLRWLCLRGGAGGDIDVAGIRVHGAAIADELNLEAATVSFPLVLRRCRLAGIDVRGADLARLDLRGSLCPSFRADRARVKADLNLGDRFTSHTVSLVGARIGGDLVCRGGHFESSTGTSLAADHIDIGGSALLDHGFVAAGEVQLSWASVAGSLACDGGRIVNRGGVALAAEGIRIGAHASFRQRFRAVGEVRLTGASIAGNLSCDGARLLNRKRTALMADRAQIGGNASFGEGFRAAGEVRLMYATLGGNLACRGGVFVNRKGMALFCDQARIARNVFLSSRFRALGEVRFWAATIGGRFAGDEARLINPAGYALQLGQATIGSVSLGRKLCAVGTVTLDAVIAGRLECDGRFRSSPDVALYLDGARIGGDLRFGESCRVRGKASLIGISVGGILVGEKSRFLNGDRVALNIEGSQVGGGVFLSKGFRARGEVRLVGTTIGTVLQCEGGWFFNRGKRALSAELIKVGAGAYFGHGFRTNGMLSFLHGSIGGGELSFVDARFIGDDADNGVELAGATIAGQLNWCWVKHSARTVLDLQGAKLGKLLDDETSWPAARRLLVEGLTYSAISPTDAHSRLRWLARQQPRPFHPQPYEQLAKVLRASGYEADAIRIAIGREDARRVYGGLGLWARGWSRLLKLTIGHGYKPHRALVGSLAFVLLGWYVFGAAHDLRLMVPAKSETAGSFSPLIYSLDTFLPIVDLDQAQTWRPDDRARCRRLGRELPCGLAVRWYLWVQILMGWVLTTLGVAALTGLVRKG